MNKKEAIKEIYMLQLGTGIRNRDKFLLRKSVIAKERWNNGEFSLGMEYGYILGLMRAFNLKKKDIIL